MNFLKSLISAGSSASSMRVIAIGVVLNIMIVWTLVCVKNLNIVDIPWGVLGMAGLVLTGKVVQKFAEEEQAEQLVGTPAKEE